MGELPNPNAGDKVIDTGQELWEIGCAAHRGRLVVAEETVTDPTSGATGTNPVWSDDVGYQTDCGDCQTALAETHRHIRAVHDSRERAAT